MGRIPLQIEISGLCTSHIAKRYITALSEQLQRILSESGLSSFFSTVHGEARYVYWKVMLKNSCHFLLETLLALIKFRLQVQHRIFSASETQKNERCATYFYQDKGLLYFLEVYCAFLRNQTRKNIHFIAWITRKDTIVDKNTLVKNFIFSFRSSCCSLSV